MMKHLGQHIFGVPKTVAVLALLCLAFNGVSGQTLYAAPVYNGTDCSMNNPCSLKTACSLVAPSGTVQLLEGQYDVGTSPCVVDVESVEIVGGAGVELTCTNSCFVFNEAPTSLSGVSVKAEDNIVSEALIFIRRTPTTPVAVMSITDIDAKINGCNFLEVIDVPVGDIGLVNMTFSMSRVSVSGNAYEDERGCIYFSATSGHSQISITDSTFSSIETAGIAPFIDILATRVAELELKDLTFTDMTMTSIIGTGASESRFENIEVSDVTIYEGFGDPIIFVSSDSAVALNITFIRVDAMQQLMLFQSVDLVAENLLAYDCVGGASAPAFDFGYIYGPEEVTLYVLGISLYDSEFSQAVQASFSTNTSSLYLFDFVMNNVTVTPGDAVLADSANFRLERFQIDDCVIGSSLFSILRPLVFRIEDGTVSNSTFGSSMVVAAEGEYPAYLDFFTTDVMDVDTDRFIELQTGEAQWKVNVTDCTFDTNAEVEAIIVCVPTESEDINTEIAVSDSVCTLSDTDDLMDDGYIASSTCNIDVDDASECANADDDDDDDDDGFNYWYVVLIVLAVLAIVVIIVSIVAIAAAYIAKKQKHADYTTI